MSRAWAFAFENSFSSFKKKNPGVTVLLRKENALLIRIIKFKFKLINISRLGWKVAHIRVEWLEFYIHSSESTHWLNLTFENRFFWHSLLREALVCWTIDRVLVLLFLYLLCRRANDLTFFGLVRQCRLPTLDCRHAHSHCFGHNLAVSLFLAQFSRKIENESWYGRFVVLN